MWLGVGWLVGLWSWTTDGTGMCGGIDHRQKLGAEVLVARLRRLSLFKRVVYDHLELKRVI